MTFKLRLVMFSFLCTKIKGFGYFLNGHKTFDSRQLWFDQKIYSCWKQLSIDNKAFSTRATYPLRAWDAILILLERMRIQKEYQYCGLWRLLLMSDITWQISWQIGKPYKRWNSIEASLSTLVGVTFCVGSDSFVIL